MFPIFTSTAGVIIELKLEKYKKLVVTILSSLLTYDNSFSIINQDSNGYEQSKFKNKVRYYSIKS